MCMMNFRNDSFRYDDSEIKRANLFVVTKRLKFMLFISKGFIRLNLCSFNKLDNKLYLYLVAKIVDWSDKQFKYTNIRV